MTNSTHYSNHDGGTWTVIYQRPGDSTMYHETTQNVSFTVNVLEAQGFIIIDIIDDSYAIPGVMAF